MRVIEKHIYVKSQLWHQRTDQVLTWAQNFTLYVPLQCLRYDSVDGRGAAGVWRDAANVINNLLKKTNKAFDPVFIQGESPPLLLCCYSQLMVIPSSTPGFFGSFTWNVPELGMTDSGRRREADSQRVRLCFMFYIPPLAVLLNEYPHKFPFILSARQQMYFSRSISESYSVRPHASCLCFVCCGERQWYGHAKCESLVTTRCQWLFAASRMMWRWRITAKHHRKEFYCPKY